MIFLIFSFYLKKLDFIKNNILNIYYILQLYKEKKIVY
jgi:hypothetical protein